MRHEALQALRVIRSIKRLSDCAAIARAELADDPTNKNLAAFVTMVEKLARDAKTKLLDRAQRAA